ncbi:MAG: DNA cytosine methyltransferase [Rhodomicrobium sp.]
MAYRFLEFFAGGGMARAGLGPRWRCELANDIDPRKAASYRLNHGAGDELAVGDVAGLAPERRHYDADLAWASFPCQDLSLAGNGAGLGGARSGSFWGFWRFIGALHAIGRHPKIVAIENVVGLLNAHNGADLLQILRACQSAGYEAGVDIIDAELFVPQSRPRLFILAARKGLAAAAARPSSASQAGRPVSAIPDAIRPTWRRWTIPAPAGRRQTLADIVEPEPSGVAWHSPHETQRLIGLMNEANRRKLKAAQAKGGLRIGTLYRRTRVENGVKAQRAEVRFDGIAGCLRTPGGGSSRQTLILAEGETVRTRLLSPREAARLMGLPDSYALPARYNEAYHLLGDGVVVPLVRHLARHLFEPMLDADRLGRAA